MLNGLREKSPISLHLLNLKFESKFETIKLKII